MLSRVPPPFPKGGFLAVRAAVLPIKFLDLSDNIYSKCDELLYHCGSQFIAADVIKPRYLSS
jgi:hypothetical protein